MKTNGTALGRAALATLFLTGGAAIPAFAGAELALRLEHGDAPGEIVFELANEGREPLSVLRTGTPLETVLSDDVFDVRRAVKGWPGVQRSPYTGRVYKRAAPRAEDFVEIAPGESLGTVVDLERFYDAPDAGEYHVDFRGRILVAAGAGLPETGEREDVGSPYAGNGQRARAGTALVDATPDADGLDVALQPSLSLFRARPPTYNGCDAGQQAALVEATGAAEGIAGEALSSLDALPEAQRATAPRYVNWFGQYSAANYRTVSEGFSAILGSLSGETLNYDCTCSEEGVFAYVYPFQLHDVYLCPTFFQASVLGTDSRAGTLVHELSHFEVLVGTDDYAYGQDAAAALASSNPASAVDNADNYEYFAENTPALPMENDGGPVTTPPDDSPTTPANPGQFATLPLDTVASGTLEEGTFALFTTSEADTLSLTSLSGDADLYVFSDPALTRETLVCSADAYSSESTLDVCELPPGTPYYIAVGGFTGGTRYELVATTQSTPTPTIDPPMALAVGSSDNRSLAAEGSALYTVPAPVRLELTSQSGNADLYAFADPSLESDQLICVSSRVGTASDACDLTGSDTAYVVVYMLTAGTYRLDALGVSGDRATGTDGTGTAPDDSPILADGSSSDESGGLGAAGWAWLLLGGAAIGLRRPRPASRTTARGAGRGEA